MTEPTVVNAPAGKRERLIGAARAMLYEQGVERTTLADIARAADVPLGNVYYYFKTKSDLVAAVVDGYETRFAVMLAALGRRRTPRARLRGLIEAWLNQRDSLAAHGCPVGALSTELSKSAASQARESGQILGAVLDWIEQQFREAGRRDARELALAMLSAYEGVVLLAHVLGDMDLITTECKRLERWVDSLT